MHTYTTAQSPGGLPSRDCYAPERARCCCQIAEISVRYKNRQHLICRTLAGGKSGNSPGRNLPTCIVINLRSSLVIINQSNLNLLRVHFIYTELGEPQYRIYYGINTPKLKRATFARMRYLPRRKQNSTHAKRTDKKIRNNQSTILKLVSSIV